jgi:hypothetical protein
MSRSSRHKRRDIARAIARRKRALETAPVRGAQVHLARLLDDVNAFGLLEQVQKHPPASLLCFGPKDIRGTRPAPYAAVIVWTRRPGYHHYKTINLLGIWALEGDPVRLVMGMRTLTYQLPFYSPESYFHRIQHDFSTFYGRETHPPRASLLYDSDYERAQRLAARRALETALNEWRRLYSTPPPPGN